MKAARLLPILLRPSVMSMTACLLLALGMLILATILYAFKNPIFYDFFFGPQGLSAALQRSPNMWMAISDAVLAGSLSYNIFILIVATMGAFVVYGSLQLFDKGVAGVGEMLSVMKSDSPHRRAIELEFGARFGLRLTSLVLWVMYTLFSFKVILPFCVVLSQVDFTTGINLRGAGYWLISFGIVTLALHVHVVLLRMLFLRLRLLGGIDATVAAIGGR